MAYIALKPIRFDRNYAISEVIPEKVVNPAMAKKHIALGSIAKIADPTPDDAENDLNTENGLLGENDPNSAENDPAENDAGGEADMPSAEEADDPPNAPEATESVAANTGSETPKKSRKK